MTAQTLDHRISDAFSSSLSSHQLRELQEEVVSAAATARSDNEAASLIALDPATRPEAVAKARRTMEDATFKAARFDKAVEGIDRLISEAEERERKAAKQAEYNEAKAERDQLAEDLKEYATMTAKIADLLGRLKASNARLALVNKDASSEEWLPSAEVVARGLNRSWLGNTSAAPTLLSSRIVSFTPDQAMNYGLLFPRAD